MTIAEQVALKKEKKGRIHPQKFALWVACASIVMFFAAFTSAYIVRKSAGNWLEFQLPQIFFFSTAVILASSVTLQWAYSAFKQSKVALYKTLIGASFGLGTGFIIMQYLGWQQLVDAGVELTTNPSSSFLFVISGFHAAHVLGGLVAIFLSWLNALRGKHKVTPVRKLRLQLTTQYWHFVDFLWLYLLIFLVAQQ